MPLNQTIEMLKALSELNRLRIVSALTRYDELCACQVTALLKLSGATVSRHLGVLQHAGLLDSRKEGRWVYYRLAPPSGTAAVMQWIENAFSESEAFQADLKSLEQIVDITREELCRRQRGEACCPK